VNCLSMFCKSIDFGNQSGFSKILKVNHEFLSNTAQERRNLKKIPLEWWNGHKDECISFSLIKMKIFIDIIPCSWVLTNFISWLRFLVKIMKWDWWKVLFWSIKMKYFNFLCLFHGPIRHYFVFCTWKSSFFYFIIPWEMFEINLKI